MVFKPERFTQQAHTMLSPIPSNTDARVNSFNHVCTLGTFSLNALPVAT